MKKKNNFYAYLLGSGTFGILDSWYETEKIVKGKNARYKGFETKTEAQKWLSAGASYQPKAQRKLNKQKLEKGIYFDAGTGRGKGTEIKVTDEKGNNLLPKGKVNTAYQTHRPQTGTNNYGELLACKFALEIALKKAVKKVFGDSRLVIEYWSKGHFKAKNVNEATIKLALEVANLRHKFEKNKGNLTHISGDINPADLGFHR